jgi:hypothetical protein
LPWTRSTCDWFGWLWLSLISWSVVVRAVFWVGVWAVAVLSRGLVGVLFSQLLRFSCPDMKVEDAP